MDIQTRLLMIRILDQMNSPEMKEFAKKIEISDESHYKREGRKKK